MKQDVRLPFISWRGGKPRFTPGAYERAMGFRGEDLKHDDGRWFTLAEAHVWAVAKHADIIEARQRRKNAGGHRIAPVKIDRNADGYIYFLRSKDRIKIGFSKNPFNRVRILRTGMPDGISALAAIPAKRNDEARIHRALDSYRQEGEWFDNNSRVAGVMTRSLAFGRVMLDHLPGAKQP